MCLIRDKVGGGDGSETITCTGKDAVNDAWLENPSYPDKLYNCDRYKYFGFGTDNPQEKLEVLGKIKSLGIISEGRISSIGYFGGQLSLANPQEQSAGENNSWTLDNSSRKLRAYYNDGTGRKYAFIIDSEGRMGFGKNPVTAYKLDLQGDARIIGDLTITGLLHLNNELSTNGNFTTSGNIVSTGGYLKSGNSIIIKGGTGGDNQDNIIYSTSGFLNIGYGEPGNAPYFSAVKVGIGTTNPVKALHVKTTHFPQGAQGSHYGIRLEDHFISNIAGGDKMSIWDIEPISDNNSPLYFSVINNDGTKTKVLTMFKNGNAGFGTDNPQSPMHIWRNSPTTGQNELLKLSNNWVDGAQNEPSIVFENEGADGTEPNIQWKIGALYSEAHSFRINVVESGVDKEFFRIFSEGDVRISYDLNVCGIINVKEVHIKKAPGCDFVFEPDFKLLSRKELAQFIWAKKHLPGIPSAKEMETEGADVGSMQSKLLQISEEHTLYLIEDDKRIEVLEKAVSDRDAKFNELQKKYEELERRVAGVEKK